MENPEDYTQMTKVWKNLNLTTEIRHVSGLKKISSANIKMIL